MATRRNANGAGEASVPPAPSASARETLDASVARLSGLNTDQLRLQWRNHLGGVAPAHLPRWLLLRVLAYRIQAAAFGDLDRAILRRLHEHREEAFEFEGRSSLCNPRTDDTRGRRAQIRSSAGPRMERPSRAGHDPRRRVRLERLRLPQPFAGRQGDHRHELERTPLLRVEGGQDRRLQQKKKRHLEVADIFRARGAAWRKANAWPRRPRTAESHVGASKDHAGNAHGCSGLRTRSATAPRLHSSDSPALRRPSNEAGRLGVCSFIHRHQPSPSAEWLQQGCLRVACRNR